MPRQRKLPDGMVARPGRRGYYADFRVAGRRVQRKLSTDFEAARAILHQLRAREDKAPYGLSDNNYPIELLRRQWEAAWKQSRKPSTVERYQGCLDNILAAISVAKVSQITESLVIEYRGRRLAEKISPRTINAEVQALGCPLNWGAGKDTRRKKRQGQQPRLIAFNPIANLEPLPHDNPKEARPLTADEMVRLFAVSPPHWRDVWYTYGVTGMRANELIQLEFSSDFIDWDSRELIIPARLAKNRKGCRIPMDEELYAILRRHDAERHLRQPGRGCTPTITAKIRAKFTRSRIFVTTANTPLQRTNLYRTFLRCCEKAGIETRTHDAEGRIVTHVDPHSLRRTFVTESISNGADPATVQQLVGHKTLQMTMNVYHKAQRQAKAQAISRLPYAMAGNAATVAASNSVHDGDPLPAASDVDAQVLAV